MSANQISTMLVTRELEQPLTQPLSHALVGPSLVVDPTSLVREVVKLGELFPQPYMTQISIVFLYHHIPRLHQETEADKLQAKKSIRPSSNYEPK